MSDNIFNPTSYKISTITATGNINTTVNLLKLFDTIEPVEPDNEGIQYIEYGKDKFKGQPKKSKNKRKPTLKKFDNQITLLIYLNEAYANCKVFKNGCIQLTGLKRIENGTKYIDYIVEKIKHNYKICPEIVDDIDKIITCNYKVRLINTDFNVGFEIRRDNLFKYMLKNHPEIYTVFEPCIYSGVKINYYHNKLNNIPGACSCNCNCNGKGSGNGIGDCNKITIAVFRSGSVLVTGGSEYEQIDDAYKFICSILKMSKKEICKEIMVEPELHVKRLVTHNSKAMRKVLLDLLV
jgi:TATA-box binding protein (TBP) (component of TFIID and TFIIIB)